MAADSERIATLYPFDALRPESRERIAAAAETAMRSRDEVLFEAGTLDETTFYLLDGVVRADYPDGRSKRIDASGLQGRYPVGDLQPRRFTATVESPTTDLLRVNRRFVEKVQTWDQLSRDENFRHYDDRPGANRWVFRLLESPALQRLPSAGIERMFRQFEEIAVARGDTVIREGDVPDHFYVIKEGLADVHKFFGELEPRVARLACGDFFGEDALLANTTRNATVSMAESGVLMRLSRQAFEAILKPPAVDWLEPGVALEAIRAGAMLIDVRMPDEYAQQAADGARNIPLQHLRETVADFDRRGGYVLYCNTGERSAAAAFILQDLGFEAGVVRGGLSALLRASAAG
jgi:rhodanese-related sulfurtransferase